VTFSPGLVSDFQAYLWNDDADYGGRLAKAVGVNGDNILRMQQQ
jgi:hypothetical protein